MCLKNFFLGRGYELAAAPERSSRPPGKIFLGMGNEPQKFFSMLKGPVLSDFACFTDAGPRRSNFRHKERGHRPD